MDTGQENGNELRRTIVEEFDYREPAKTDLEGLLDNNQFELGVSKKRKHLRLFEDSRLTNRIHRLHQLVVRCLMAFAVLCMVLSLVAKETEIDQLVRGTPMTDSEHNLIFWSSIVSMVASFLMVIINISRKILKFKQRKMRLEIRESEEFWTRKETLKILWESFMIGVTPLPHLQDNMYCTLLGYLQKEVCYNYNDFLHLFQFVKITYIIKAYLTTSMYSSSSGYRICSMYNLQWTNTFVIKSLMRDQPLVFIFTMFMFGILVFGYALRIAEAPVYQVDKSMNLADLFNCCWNAIVTMTTVGYGDFYPRTVFGRCIMFVCCLYGMIMTSLMVSYVSQELTLSSGEYKAFVVICRLNIRRNVKQKATRVLNKFAHVIVLRKQGQSAAVKRKNLLRDMYNQCKDIHLLNLRYKNTQDLSPEEDMDRNFELISREMRSMKFLMKTLKDGLDRLNNVKNTSRRSPDYGQLRRQPSNHSKKTEPFDLPPIPQLIPTNVGSSRISNLESVLEDVNDFDKAFETNPT